LITIIAYDYASCSHDGDPSVVICGKMQTHRRTRHHCI